MTPAGRPVSSQSPGRMAIIRQIAAFWQPQGTRPLKYHPHPSLLVEVTEMIAFADAFQAAPEAFQAGTGMSYEWAESALVFSTPRRSTGSSGWGSQSGLLNG
jgi:hypothetical protein